MRLCCCFQVEETKNDLQNDLKKELYHRLQVELGTIEEASSFEVKETKNDLKNDLKKELSYRLQVALGTIEEASNETDDDAEVLLNVFKLFLVCFFVFSRKTMWKQHHIYLQIANAKTLLPQ